MVSTPLFVNHNSPWSFLVEKATNKLLDLNCCTIFIYCSWMLGGSLMKIYWVNGLDFPDERWICSHMFDVLIWILKLQKVHVLIWHTCKNYSGAAPPPLFSAEVDRTIVVHMKRFYQHISGHTSRDPKPLAGSKICFHHRLLYVFFSNG
jgi:hypothetical protein